MDDASQDDGQEVMDDNAEASTDEDQAFDNFEDAAAALADDDDGEEVSEDNAEAPETDNPDADDEADEDADFVIALPDGEEVTASQLKEWRDGALRQEDYTRKTMTLAEERETLTKERESFGERATFVENLSQNLLQFVEGLIPPEPPLSLAQTDPGKYTQQIALRQQAMREIKQLADTSSTINAKKGEYSQADWTQYRTTEDGKLAKAMPALKDPARLDAFNKSVAASAEQFGFTADEVSKTADARIRQVLHYAAMGKRAEANRKNAARRVETPKPGKARPAQVSAQANSNREAMRSLSKSGSIKDALKIDFE